MATYDPERFAQAMAAAPKTLYKRLRKELDPFTFWFATKHFPRYMNQRLRRRTGALAKSFGRSVTGNTFDNTRWNIYSTSPYAPYQQMGADAITPKSSKYLTIPLSGALTQTGRKRGSARSFENTFVRRTKKGHLIMFQRVQDEFMRARKDGWADMADNRRARMVGGKYLADKRRARKGKRGKFDRRIRPLFLLLPKVSLQPRLQFFEEWDRHRQKLMERVAAAVDFTMKKLES